MENEREVKESNNMVNGKCIVLTWTQIKGKTLVLTEAENMKTWVSYHNHVSVKMFLLPC